MEDRLGPLFFSSCFGGLFPPHLNFFPAWPDAVVWRIVSSALDSRKRYPGVPGFRLCFAVTEFISFD